MSEELALAKHRESTSLVILAMAVGPKCRRSNAASSRIGLCSRSMVLVSWRAWRNVERDVSRTLWRSVFRGVA